MADMALGAGYFLAASASLLLTRFDGGVAFLWFASPLLIAVLMVRPRRLWSGAFVTCAIGSSLATGLFGVGWSLALPFAFINMVEAYIAARLFREFDCSRTPLGSTSWLLYFVLSVGVAGPAVSAALAALAMADTQGLAPTTLVHFFAGHALGNIAFIPVVALAVAGELRTSLHPGPERRNLEALLLLAIVALTTAAVFTNETVPLLFLPMLPIMMVAFRLGPGGAAISIVLLAVIGGGLTLSGQGPIQAIDPALGAKMQFFQLYLTATVLTVFPVAADLRNRGRLHAELRASEERYKLLAEHSTDIILHLQLDGTILYASPSVRQLGDYEPSQLEGRNIMMLVPPEGRGDVRQGFMETLETAGTTHSYRHLAMTAEGERRWFESHCRVLLDEAEEPEGILSVVRDISRQVEIEERLSKAAMTDALTGLANRRSFLATIERRQTEEGSSGRDCLALFDIDHFKRVNDDFGHQAGDEVLRAFAAVARRMVRGGDLVARLGGEEFAVHFPQTSIDQAAQICDRIRVEMARTATFVGDVAVHVTISGGVALIGDRGLNAALKAADEALYSAKKSGRDKLSLAA